MALEKQQTGIASEYYVAAELSRLGYDVSVTFGNTKSVDLLVHKNDDAFTVQVKGIQQTKSICWNLNKGKIVDKPKLIFVLVNLHANDKKQKPEFFVLTQPEALELFKETGDVARSYLGYNFLKANAEKYQDRWNIFDNQQNAAI